MESGSSYPGGSLYSEQEITGLSLSYSGFSAKDFSWSTSASDVAYMTDDGFLVTTGEGYASLYARYTNQSGQIINALFKVYVMKNTLPHFKYDTYTATYSASNLAEQDFAKVEGNNSNHAYSYFYVSGDGLQKTQEIKNCGEYLIKCHLADDENTIVDEMTLIVEKATINIPAINCYSIYGEDTSSSDRENVFYYAGDTNRVYDKGIISSIGDDANLKIGEFCYTTTASINSQVSSSYQTSIDYKLYDEFAKNYAITKTSGRHTILKREVLISLNSRSLPYGTTLSVNDFKVYEYQENYEQIGYEFLNELDKSYYLTSGDIVANEYSFYDKEGVKIGEDSSLLDASDDEYSVTYNSLKSKGNLLVKVVIPGKISIMKRNITVLVSNPSSNFGKIYGEQDDLSALEFNLGENALFKNRLNLSSAVYVDYKGLNYGEKNVKAPVGIYSYGIENNQNNFNLILSSDSDKFYVKSLSINLSFEDIDVAYKPTSSDVTINYYSLDGAENDYDVSILSLQIKGERIIENGTFVENNGLCDKDENFETNGLFVLKSTGDKFGFSLTNSEDAKATRYYKRYKISLAFDYANSNFELNTVDFYLGIEKVMVPILPLDEGNSAVYSGAPPVSLADYLKRATTSSGIDLTDIIADGSQIFALTDENGNYQTQSDTILQSAMDWSVGKYKLFISSALAYKQGQDYYAFYIDGDCYFEITKQGVVVTPLPIEKVYGNDDEEIKYELTLEGGGEIYLTGAEGHLSRSIGEDVGSYLINAGNLSFGKNYKVIFSNPDEICYLITPRELLIKPYNADITYGENFPVNNASSGDFDIEVVGQYNSNILVLPNKNTEFEGYFYLSETGSESNLAVKLNGYYRVGSYKIVLGEEKNDGFKYVGFLNASGQRIQNYTIKIDTSSSSCVIRPKTAYIDFISQSVSNLPYAENGSLELNSIDNANLLSSASLLDGDVLSVSFNYSVVPNALVYVEDFKDIYSIVVTRAGENVTDCYNFVLRDSVLYEKDTEIINMLISPISPVGSDDYSINGNLLTVGFDGENKKQCFEITFTSSAGNSYVLSDKSEGYLRDNTDVSKWLVFIKNAACVEPKDAGSYIVSFVLDNESITLNKLIPGAEPEKDTSVEFTFSAFNTISNNCYLQLKQNAYLTITKANITVDESLVAFDESKQFVYGQSKENLPKLSTTTGAFKDINGNNIELFEYNGLNFEYVSSSEGLEYLSTGYHLISVMITKATSSGGEIDTNYNSKIIDVMLNVCPREIRFDDLSFSFKQNGEIIDISSAVVYNGDTISCSISPSSVAYISNIAFDSQNEESTLYERGGKYYFETDKYNIVYNIYPIEFVFDEEVCYVNKYSWNSTLARAGEYEESVAVPSSISSISIRGGYVVIDDSYCLRISTSAPQMQNSCVYVCVPVISTLDENYTISVDQTSYIIEIDRLTEGFEITAENTKFYQGTIVNPNRPQDIIELFGMTMSPNLIDKIAFADSNTWAESNYVLPVGSYKLGVLLDNPEDELVKNYYYSTSISFEILMRKAEINFPLSTDWAYSGEPIDSFLSFINVTLYDVGGVKQVKYYNSVQDYFTIEVYDVSGNKLDDYTSSIGQYILHAKYKDDTYESEGEFSSWIYNIVPTQYTGTPKFTDPKFTYDPSIDYEVLYNRIVDQITIDGFKMNTPEAKEIVNDFVIYVSNSEIDSQEKAESDGMKILPSSEMTEEEKKAVIKNIMSQASSFYLTCQMTFVEETFSDLFKGVTTSIGKTAIEANEFSIKPDVMFNGRYQYVGLMWGAIDLSPYYNEEQYFGSAKYTLETKESGGDYIVTLLDSFGNEVFHVTYSYSFNGSATKPLQPRLYELNYTISFSGAMYESSEGFVNKSDEVTFWITKPYIIKVNCSAPEKFVYDGSDLKDSILENVSFVVSAESQSGTTSVDDVYYTFGSINDPYKESDGIMLYYKIYSDPIEGDNPLKYVLYAGDYIIRIGFCNCMKTTEWSKDVKFRLNNAEQDYIDIKFSITKKPLSDEVSAQSFAAGFFYDYEREEETIIINKDSTLNVVGSCEISSSITALKISNEYAIVVYANNGGIETSLIQDFETTFFNSEYFGTADMANIYIYKLNSDGQIDNNYSRTLIKVKFS